MQFNEFTVAFNKFVMPILYDGIDIVFRFSLLQGGFYIMRGDKKAGIDRIKFATIGFLGIKFINTFINIINDVAQKATLGM